MSRIFAQPPNGRPTWGERFYGWVLRQSLQDPRQNRIRSIFVITVLVAVIGWVDFITGTKISLSLFYSIPIAFTVAWLGWRIGILTGVVSVVVRVFGDLDAGGYAASPTTIFWNRMVDLANYLVLIAILHALFTLQRQLDQRVRQRTNALEKAIAARDELQNELFDVGRRERSAIGHDLHDGLGQHLTATSFAAELLARDLGDNAHPAYGKARNIVGMVQEGIAKTRQIARGLLLAAIEPADLASELDELAGTLASEYRIPCEFTTAGVLSGLDVSAASHLFYIAKEAAQNAMRHSPPTSVKIKLVAESGILTLSVCDDGSGVPAIDGPQVGIGLRIMAHRAGLIHGSFSISPGAGSGTEVQCRLRLDNGRPSTTP